MRTWSLREYWARKSECGQVLAYASALLTSLQHKVLGLLGVPLSIFTPRA